MPFDIDDMDPDGLPTWGSPDSHGQNQPDWRRPEEPVFACKESFTATYAEVATTSQMLRTPGRTEWVSSLAQRLDEMGCPPQISRGFQESMEQAGQYLVLDAAVYIAALIVRFVGSGERGRILKYARALDNVRSFQITQDTVNQTYTLHITGELPYATGGPVQRRVTEGQGVRVEVVEQPKPPHVEAPRRLRVRRTNGN